MDYIILIDEDDEGFVSEMIAAVKAKDGKLTEVVLLQSESQLKLHKFNNNEIYLSPQSIDDIKIKREEEEVADGAYNFQRWWDPYKREHLSYKSSFGSRFNAQDLGTEKLNYYHCLQQCQQALQLLTNDDYDDDDDVALQENNNSPSDHQSSVEVDEIIKDVSYRLIDWIGENSLDTTARPNQGVVRGRCDCGGAAQLRSGLGMRVTVVETV
ncbi:hypothetical protein ACFE04_025573 [Oxalis oulophora]